MFKNKLFFHSHFHLLSPLSQFSSSINPFFSFRSIYTTYSKKSFLPLKTESSNLFISYQKNNFLRYKSNEVISSDEKKKVESFQKQNPIPSFQQLQNDSSTEEEVVEIIRVSPKVPKGVVIGGIISLLPMIGSTIGLILPVWEFEKYFWLIPYYPLLFEGLITWSGTLLTALSSVHFALALVNYPNEKTPKFGRYFVFSIGTLAAWLSINLPPDFGFPLLITSFSGIHFFDLYSSANENTPSWYAKIRLPFTLIVLTCLTSCMFIIP